MISRSVIARGSAVAIAVALAVFLFVIGKGHTIYLDTNLVGDEETGLRAPEYSAVTVNALEPEEMGRAERVTVTVTGGKHTVKVEPLDGSAEPVTRVIRIPLSMRDVVVSIPAIMANAPDKDVVYPFVMESYEDQEAEQTVQQEESDVIQVDESGNPLPAEESAPAPDTPPAE